MNVFDFTVENGEGEKVSLKDYEGQVLLIINSATECGFTPQYDELQDLYEKYSQEGFNIIDFPCNQFGHQAPGTNEEIALFCSSRFGITFPVFSKIDVNGDDAIPLFKYLKAEKGFKGFDKEHPLTETLNKILSEADPNYDKDPSIKWNFTKFLVDKSGKVVERFEPTTPFYVIEEAIKELI